MGGELPPCSMHREQRMQVGRGGRGRVGRKTRLVDDCGQPPSEGKVTGGHEVCTDITLHPPFPSSCNPLDVRLTLTDHHGEGVGTPTHHLHITENQTRPADFTPAPHLLPPGRWVFWHGNKQ